MGSWADHDGGRYPPGTAIEVSPGSDVARARETMAPIRTDGHGADSPVGELGYTASIVSPVRVGATAWGALAVTVAEPGQLTAGDEQLLQEFGDLLATAIASIDDRAKLAAQAATDPLTGLANRRSARPARGRARPVHQALADAVGRGDRHRSLQGGQRLRRPRRRRRDARAGRPVPGGQRPRRGRARPRRRRRVRLGDARDDARAGARRGRAGAAADRGDRLAAVPDHRLGGDLRHERRHGPGRARRASPTRALYWSKAHGRNRVLDLRPGRDRGALGGPGGRADRELAGADRAAGAGPRDRRQGPGHPAALRAGRRACGQARARGRLVGRARRAAGRGRARPRRRQGRRARTSC